MDVKRSRGLPKSGTTGESKKKRKQFPKKFGKSANTKSVSADPRREMLEMLKARTDLSEAQLLQVDPDLGEDFKNDQIFQNQIMFIPLQNQLHHCYKKILHHIYLWHLCINPTNTQFLLVVLSIRHKNCLAISREPRKTVKFWIFWISL